MDRIELAKIDVEGAELAVLRGAEKSIVSGTIQCLIVEVNDERARAFGYDFRECVEYVIAGNSRYEFYRILKGRLGLRRVFNSSEYENGDNLLAVLQDTVMWRRLRQTGFFDVCVRS